MPSNYIDKELNSSRLSKVNAQQRTGEQKQVVKETNIWEDGKDIIRRFKPTAHYLDPEIGAQAGVEQMLFGGGPNVGAQQANMANAQLFQQYQQMGMPHVSPGQSKLKERILGTDVTNTQTIDGQMLEDQYNDFQDRQRNAQYGSGGIPMVEIGQTKAGDTRHEFLSSNVTIPKSSWDKSPHWDYLKSRFGDEATKEWQNIKDYLKDYIDFHTNSKGDISMVIRPGAKLGMNQTVADIIPLLFSGHQEEADYSKDIEKIRDALRGETNKEYNDKSKSSIQRIDENGKIVNDRFDKSKINVNPNEGQERERIIEQMKIRKF